MLKDAHMRNFMENCATIVVIEFNFRENCLRVWGCSFPFKEMRGFAWDDRNGQRRSLERDGGSIYYKLSNIRD